MNWLTKLNTIFAPQHLSRGRIALALIVALGADLLQIVLLPVAWTFAQQAIDVIAMVFIVALLGFHLLFLPTFAVEFVPGVDMLPTWTACVIAVIAMRKRQSATTIDVSSEVLDVPPKLPNARKDPADPHRD